MGLDMYLKARRWIRSYDDKEKALGESLSRMMPELENIGIPVQEITIEAAYWRKANAIHDWFVREIQDNKDDCGAYEVSREKLGELKKLCQRVLDFKHLGNELLPTRPGFFFGDTEYNEWYFEDLNSTISQLDRALGLPDQWYFEYHASW